MDQRRLAECVFDITQEVDSELQNVFKKNPDFEIDSREIFADVYHWAVEFEKNYTDDIDYLPAITEYAHHQFIRNYGPMIEYIQEKQGG